VGAATFVLGFGRRAQPKSKRTRRNDEDDAISRGDLVEAMALIVGDRHAHPIAINERGPESGEESGGGPTAPT
jgi:hypothetical protein